VVDRVPVRGSNKILGVDLGVDQLDIACVRFCDCVDK